MEGCRLVFQRSVDGRPLCGGLVLQPVNRVREGSMRVSGENILVEETADAEDLKQR